MTPEDWANLDRWDKESKAGHEADGKIADFYYEHRDDPDWLATWEVVPHSPRKKSRKPPGIVVSVRFDAPDLKAMEDTAEREGLTISALVRRSVLEYAERHRVTVRLIANRDITVSAG